MPGLDLSSWQSDEEPEFTTEASETEVETATPPVEEVNEDLIRTAIEKAKQDMNERAKFEYSTWLNGKRS